MSDIRRTVLWVVFSMAIVMLWDGWAKHNGRPSMFAPPSPAPVAETAPDRRAELPTPVADAAPNTSSSTAETAISEKVLVSTDVVKATIDPLGGTLIRLELLGQPDLLDRSRNVVLLDQSAQRYYIARTGLVSTSAGANLPNHLTPMRFEPGPTVLEDGQNELKIRFVAESGGVKWLKTYTFQRSAYVIHVQQEIINESPLAVNPQVYFELVRDGNPPPGDSKLYFTFTGPALYTENSHFKKVSFDDIAKKSPADHPGHDTAADNGWVAMIQHYFASAWLLGLEGDEKRDRSFHTKKIGNNQYAIGMVVPLGSLAPGERSTLQSRLFAGPQEEYKLEKLATGLELVKDYGRLAIIAKPMFWLLSQLHHFLGNWGWSIVALVVLLKLAFYGLNANAYRSMAKMKSVGPRIMEMRERFKDNPQQMQQEMMRIYREEKVNPLGGCLPMLVQMPFFIALYWVLLSSAEMRGAPWLGWIQDLSTPDPFYILPLLMTATSLLQTWLNPTPPDSLQARMMWIMPLLFSAMFFFFPAGLVLYWFINNLLSIAQQYLINKRMGVQK